MKVISYIALMEDGSASARFTHDWFCNMLTWLQQHGVQVHVWRHPACKTGARGQLF